MKTLLLGILLIVVVGIGGLVYRNALEHPIRPVACPVDARVCPDGTAVVRTGLSCSFPVCPSPNVSLSDARIAFALPAGFTALSTVPDSTAIAQYQMRDASSTEPNTITIRRFAVSTSTTPLAVIRATAVGGTSGAPVNPTSFTSTTLGTHRFTVVAIERFEGVVTTAYYLVRGSDVVRFDATDRGVNWTDPDLDISTLPAHAALRTLLATLQGE